MKTVYEVNRAMLNPHQRGEIERMIKAFELCYAEGQKSRAESSRYICYRLETLCDNNRISPTTKGRCESLVMRALNGSSTLNAWWWRRLPAGERERCNYWPVDMPKHYRQLWLKQIIKDLRWLLN